MLRSEAVASIQRHLAFRVDQEDNARLELQHAQEAFERRGVPCPPPYQGVFWPHFLLSDMAEAPVEANEERIPKPDDFLAESEEDGFFRYVTDTSWKPLRKGTTKELRGLTGDAPVAYSVSGNYFRIFPVPTQVYFFRTVYYAQDASLASADIENNWLKYAADLLIGDAGWRLAVSLRDANAAQIFAAMKVDAQRTLFMSNENALHVNQRYVMGGDN